jgi:hypothetical protein
MILIVVMHLKSENTPSPRGREISRGWSRFSAPAPTPFTRIFTLRAILNFLRRGYAILTMRGSPNSGEPCTYWRVKSARFGCCR